jgi:hypothetical protein
MIETSKLSFLHFVSERESIRVKRAQGLPAPWTDDPILHKYKFTNIRRKDDRVSKWVIEHLIEPATDSGDEYLWFTLLIARLINWPPTLKALLDVAVLPCHPHNFDADKFVKTLEAIKSSGAKVYSGAYMLYPTKQDPGGIKSRAVARYIIGDVIKRSAVVHEAVWSGVETGEHSVEKIVSALSKCFGISTFMAGQVAADLTYTGLDFVDAYTWAPLGPGSQQGLNLMTGQPLYHLWRQSDFNALLILLNRWVSEELKMSDLSLHDVQNCCCEYSKYAKKTLGIGKPKSTYKPETEF